MNMVGFHGKNSCKKEETKGEEKFTYYYDVQQHFSISVFSNRLCHLRKGFKFFMKPGYFGTGL